MQLQRIKIGLFRNLQDVGIVFNTTLQPSTVSAPEAPPKPIRSHALIGQNGTGKSNLIEALITISQAMRERIVNGLSIEASSTPTDVRALRFSAMSDQGLDFNEYRYLPIALAKAENILIDESDFFVSRGNGSLDLVGRGSVAIKPPCTVIFPDTMMRIRFAQVAGVGPWFHSLWSTRLVRSQIEKRVKTTAGIYKMAQPELASITIPFPPIAEQIRIVAEVDRHLSIVREVEAEIDTNLKRAQVLRQATLAKAFAY